MEFLSTVSTHVDSCELLVKIVDFLHIYQPDEAQALLALGHLIFVLSSAYWNYCVARSYANPILVPFSYYLRRVLGFLGEI